MLEAGVGQGEITISPDNLPPKCMRISQMIYRLFLMVLVILFTNPVVPLASEQDVETLVRKIDALYRSATRYGDADCYAALGTDAIAEGVDEGDG